MLLIIIVLLLSISEIFSQTDTLYYQTDLNTCENDELDIKLRPPKLEDKVLYFKFPSIIPGTYDVYNFGRFVKKLTAFDNTNHPIKINHSDDNTWEIDNSNGIAKILYTIEDTYDTELTENFVFEPAGTNFEKGKNFILNNHGIFGYLYGHEGLPYSIKITKPDSLLGISSLFKQYSSDQSDVYVASDYYQLVDAPIMYAKADTAKLQIANTSVTISVYSANHIVKASFVRKNIEKMLLSVKDYFDGSLPVNNYTFLFYFFHHSSVSGGSGALEHNYSSLYHLPETEPQKAAMMIKDIAAHEFLHIITPLNVHSEEIHFFNFDKPDMSKHLWFYEGVTEYLAMHIQVTQGIWTQEEFIEELRSKITNSRFYDDTLPFTELSKNCLDKYHSQFNNVYNKGALIGLCLDILLHQYSDNTYSLKQLMQDLSLTYGKNKPFDDNDFFDKIISLTVPETKAFINNYIEGNMALPIEVYLSFAGIEYEKSIKYKEFNLGRIGIRASNDFILETGEKRYFISSIDQMNDFGKKLGFKKGDVLISLNGEDLHTENFTEVYKNYKLNVRKGDKVFVQVLRQNTKGKWKTNTLKAGAFATTVNDKDILYFNEEPTENQVKIRNKWLNISE